MGCYVKVHCSIWIPEVIAAQRYKLQGLPLHCKLWTVSLTGGSVWIEWLKEEPWNVDSFKKNFFKKNFYWRFFAVVWFQLEFNFFRNGWQIWMIQIFFEKAAKSRKRVTVECIYPLNKWWIELNSWKLAFRVVPSGITWAEFLQRSNSRKNSSCGFAMEFNNWFLVVSRIQNTRSNHIGPVKTNSCRLGTYRFNIYDLKVGQSFFVGIHGYSMMLGRLQFACRKHDSSCSVREFGPTRFF